MMDDDDDEDNQITSISREGQQSLSRKRERESVEWRRMRIWRVLFKPRRSFVYSQS
jgi:hypothetical protein